jgi:hypothetical protein
MHEFERKKERKKRMKNRIDYLYDWIYNKQSRWWLNNRDMIL